MLPPAEPWTANARFSTLGEKNRFARVRIGMHDIIGLIVNGATIEDVLRSYPEVTQAQVYECLAETVSGCIIMMPPSVKPSVRISCRFSGVRETVG